MDAPAAGDLIADRYEVLELLAQVGPERVYRGRDTATGQPVRVRMLPTQAQQEDPGRATEIAGRYEREHRAVHGLEHPNVLPSRALERDAQGNLYLVMDDVGGCSLAEVLAASGPLPPARAIAVACDVAAAIEAIYDRGIVHRDITPRNILIGTDGAARLTGFGVAQLASEAERASSATAHPGTPAYKSPEQATNTGYLDQRSDLYALAAVLYEMLTGRVYAHRREPLREAAPSVPAALAAVVTRGLERDPDARYQTARQMIADLERVQGQSTWGQLGIVLRRIRPARVATTLGILALLSLSVSIWRLAGALSAPPGQASVEIPEDALETVLPPDIPPDRGGPRAQALVSDDATGLGSESATPLSDLYEPDDTDPVPIAVGEVQHRAFDRQGDVDRAVLRVQAGHEYVVSVENPAPGVEPALQVLVGGHSLTGDGQEAGSPGSVVRFGAEADGVAVITVTNEGNYGPESTYALTVSSVAPTQTPTPTFSVLPTRTPRPTYTPMVATATPRPTNTPAPTSTPRPAATPSPTSTPTSPTATRTPTMTPTPRATATPSNTPTPEGSPLPPVRPTGPPTQ